MVASMSSSVVLYDEVDIYLTASPMVAKIEGGAEGTVCEENMIWVDASKSFDPDDSSNIPVFEWTVTMIYSLDETTVAPEINGNPNKITIDRLIYKPGDVLLFSVKVIDLRNTLTRFSIA